jgi:competence protein ComEC
MLRYGTKKTVIKSIIVLLFGCIAAGLAFPLASMALETAARYVYGQNPDIDRVRDILELKPPLPKQISVHFLDVGNADCIFIDAGSLDILIDGGNNDDGEFIVDYLMELGTDNIELMIATHPHLDHVGGLDDVLNAFDVKAVIDSGHSSVAGTYQDYMNAVIGEEAILLEDTDMKFRIAEGFSLKIIETGDNYADMNNNSVVCLLTFGQTEFLFTGDMGRMAEMRSLNKFPQADVLKVGHHGSRSSSCAAFLDCVNPVIAVMSCGICNVCGQPHGQNVETVKELDRRGIPLYRTDILGTVIITTDGKTLSVDNVHRDRGQRN